MGLAPTKGSRRAYAVGAALLAAVVAGVVFEAAAQDTESGDKTLRIVRSAPWTGTCEPRSGAVEHEVDADAAERGRGKLADEAAPGKGDARE